MSLAADTALADAETFEAFYERTSAGLWRYLRRVGGDPFLAEDLVQESYLRFLRRKRLKPDRRQQTAYLYAIATNLLRDRWRRRKREDDSAVLEPRRSPESAAPDGLGRDLAAALEELSQRDRALLWLAYVEGYDHREIANVLGLAALSVRVLLFRARGRAADVLRRKGLDLQTATPPTSETTS